MKVSWKLLAAVALVAALSLSGCGGGGGGTGGGSGGGTQGQVTIDLRGADWAAYSASAWQEIDIASLGADKTFTFTPGTDGKYGVAIHCDGSGGDVTIYQSTADEMPSVSGECVDDDEATTYEVNGTIAGLQGN